MGSGFSRTTYAKPCACAVRSDRRLANARGRLKPASNNGSPINGYVITPFLNDVAEPPKIYDSTALSQVVDELQSGQKYKFEVAARNGAGTGANSLMSNVVSPK